MKKGKELWGGGKRRDTVKGALPYDLGFYCRVPGHLIFPPGQPRKPTLPGPGINGLVMCLGRAEGFAEAPGNHEITVPHTHTHARALKKLMQLDTDGDEQRRRG